LIELRGLRRRAHHQREVRLLHALLVERALQRDHHLIGLREEQAARRVFVEAMHDARLVRATHVEARDLTIG
jgi:hypothetical protein